MRSIVTLAGAARRPFLSTEALLLAALGVCILGLCVLPMLRLLATLFAAGLPEGAGFVLQVWSRPASQNATLNTLDSGFWSTLLAMVLGGGMALLISLTDLRGKPVLVLLLILPLLVPPQISALAWMSLIGPQSLLWTLPGLESFRPMRNPLLGREGVIMVMAVEHAPIVFLALTAGLRALPADLVDAARGAGSRPAGVVLRIILPLMWPALVAGAALAFVSAIGNFGIPALLGIPGRYPVLSTLIYQRLSGFGPTALPEVAALALILALIAAAGIALQALALRRLAVATDRAGGGHRGFRLGPARGWVSAAAWALMAVLAILPLLALLGAALVPSVGVRLTLDSLTLNNLIHVVTDLSMTRRAFANSLTLATLAAVLTMVAAVPLGWLLARGYRAARVLNLGADVPYVLPGIVLSIAFILTFLPPLPILGISLYNTLWILLLAYLARFFALALRPVVSALSQLDPALEEAARGAGARSLFRLATIVLPLVAPAVGAGAIL
ncbi:MAG: ABC transporter permease, partial [Pararhodobacter sp.]